MKLNEYANNILGQTEQSGDLWKGIKFNYLNESLGGFENANPMLVTTTWQALLESPDLSKKLYPNAVRNISSYAALSTNLEKYLLCLGDNKYCLLVFDPNFTSDEPIHIDASKNNTKASINSCFCILQSKMKNASEIKNQIFYL